MAVLEMKEILYAYRNGKPILSNINAGFEAGKMYAVLGASGSGKTTLLSLLGGLDIPTKGEILFERENILQRALASDTPVILADEPTGNLDADTAAGIINILKESAHELSKCVIVVTHSNELAAQADLILELRRGSLHYA